MEIFISKGEKMTFKESITSVYFKNYANFEGKASRSELWWATLFYLIVSLVGGFFIGLNNGNERNHKRRRNAEQNSTVD